MAICTTDQVKASARVDGVEFDAQIAGYIAAAQALIEHECGAAPGAFATSPDPAATQCAIALCVQMIDTPTAGREELAPILRSALLDGARAWT